MTFVTIWQDVQILPVLGSTKNAVVLLAAGVALEFVNGTYFEQLFGIEAVEIVHGSHGWDVIAADALLGGNDLSEGLKHRTYQPVCDPVVTGQEGVLLKETLATGAAVAAFAQVQKGVSVQRNLHPVIVDNIRHSPTGRATMPSSMQF